MTKSNVGVPLTDRFWQRVPHRPVDGCWEWAGERNNMGYGRISEYRGGVRVRHLAHRFSLALVQDVPKDAVVRHRCDNPVCVNPDHLEVGTQRDNVRDAIARGRFNATGLKDGRRVRTHCRRGHALTPQNRLASGNCKSCNRIYQAAYRARCGLTTEERHQVIAHRMPA